MPCQNIFKSAEEQENMRLFIVRHGETTENLNHVTQGQLNTKLTAKGIEQAKKVALRLQKEHIEYCYSSDLGRCVRTAEEILKFHAKVKLVKAAELREQAKCIYEGKPKTVRKKDSAGQEWWQFHPKGGESMEEVWHRVIWFYEEIRERHSNSAVLIVTHGGAISCLLAKLHGGSLQDTGKYKGGSNASLSIANISEKGCAFEAVKCAAH